MRPAILLALTASVLGSAVPEDLPGPRQFDFWLGEWEVVDAQGRLLGHNRVEALLGGAVLQEHWQGKGGGTGTSLNTYQPGLGTWRQCWMDARGACLDLEGRLEGGRMVLKGTTRAPQGVRQERITWTPLADGRVRQLWEQRSGEAEPWSVVFEGFYQRLPR